MKKYLLILLLLAAFLGISAGYIKITAQSAKPTAVKYDAKKDKLVTPTRQDITDQITLAGSISASGVANLRFQNSGKLVWVGVKIGDKVKKYQAIASLDQQELKKSLQSQFNNYRTQLSQFWDTQDKYKDLVISDTIQRILNRTQYSLDNTVINYEIADMATKESTLVSPITGVVVSLDQPIAGANITPASATFTIVDPNTIYFTSEADESVVTQIALGNNTQIKLDSFPDTPINAKIDYISFAPITGQSSTVYEVRFAIPLDNQDLKYRLGMNGDASIFIKKSAQALTIPLDAVYDDNGQSYVFLKSGSELTRQNITTGIETDTDVEVLSGLTGNETIVIKIK
ncbi:MAG: efflux RND transporter periplasmic adaptor subunit [Candidatus Shapirobacteria bacterium]|nr:efflux RND transporter periplasmic adaptor subunit [Candidatus Shapirobacteria bacterium]